MAILPEEDGALQLVHLLLAGLDLKPDFPQFGSEQGEDLVTLQPLVVGLGGDLLLVLPEDSHHVLREAGRRLGPGGVDGSEQVGDSKSEGEVQVSPLGKPLRTLARHSEPDEAGSQEQNPGDGQEQGTSGVG